MKSDLLCVIPEQLCFGFAEHIFKSVGCCVIILFQGVGVDVHGRGSLCMTQTVGHGSLDNYLYLEANGQMSFIKPTNGKRNIRIELFFLALGFNLKKRWMKQQKSRLETHYSEKKAS